MAKLPSSTAERGSPSPFRVTRFTRRLGSSGKSCSRAGAKLHTSVPVVIETFTFLDRNANRDVALAWKESIYEPGTVKILPCELRDLGQSWEYFRRADLHKLSAVDATSFAIMKRARIRLAFTFDHHFSIAGFRLVA